MGLSSHDISTIKYLFNQDIKVKVLTHNLLNSKLSDISTISLKGKSINVEIKSSWINPEKIRKLIIVGNKKMLQFDEMDQKTKLKYMINMLNIPT